MSKAVLISIQPKWCELIASGKKTEEVRKTKPKLETPFKVYIYCTKKKKEDEYGKTLVFYEDDNGICEENGKRFSPLETGKVIGEFVCDCIGKVGWTSNPSKADWKDGFNEETCLTNRETYEYTKGEIFYEWHISDLVIYDEPKELSEFYRECEQYVCENCPYLYVENTPNCYETYCEVEGKIPIKRPPQSWCYVEEMKGGAE